MSEGQSSSPATLGPPLWRLLCLTAQVMQAAERGHSWAQSQGDVPADCKSAVQSLAFACWRNWGRARALSRALVQKPPAPDVAALLHVALALLSADGEAAYGQHTLVNQAVEAVRSKHHTAHAAGLLNAVLRRFQRERALLLAQLASHPEAQHQHPAWWLARLKADHPGHWQAICAANNRPAPLVIRYLEGFDPLVHLKPTSDATKNEVIEWQRVGSQAWLARPAVGVQQLTGFMAGRGMVQDAAAQLAAPLLLASLPREAPLRILDACAAPGGKTAHLLELAPQAHVTALDASAKRLPRIAENLQRMGLMDEARVALKAGDATEPQAWWDGAAFDAILIDAPCSASGIVRRQPDVRWIRRESDVAQLVALQAQILVALWPLLKPGGILVYCTCSVFRQEGEGQAQAFEMHHKDACRMPAPGQLLPRHALSEEAFTQNSSQGSPADWLSQIPLDHDGFYFARFQKRSG